MKQLCVGWVLLLSTVHDFSTLKTAPSALVQGLYLLIVDFLHIQHKLSQGYKFFLYEVIVCVCHLLPFS